MSSKKPFLNLLTAYGSLHLKIQAVFPAAIRHGLNPAVVEKPVAVEDYFINSLSLGLGRQELAHGLGRVGLLQTAQLVLQLAAQGGGCRQRLAFAIVDDLGIDMFAAAEDRETEPRPAADFLLDPPFPFQPRRFLGVHVTILL